MDRVGIAISGGPNPAEIVDVGVPAESLGYESAWLAEGHGGDQFVILATCTIVETDLRNIVARSSCNKQRTFDFGSVSSAQAP